MTRALMWLDRLRIERLVWSLDQRLYDLPAKSRIAKRREVRANLVSAAQDVGTTAALRGLGDSRLLADEYLSAEFGNQARPSWIAAGLFLSTGQLVLTSMLSDAAFAFRDGIIAVDPHASGTYTWTGIKYLQSAVTYRFVDGRASSVGGAWTPIAWVIWIVAAIMIGRLWRAIPLWRRRRANAAARGD